MVHDIYYERQRALIERSLAREREEAELEEAIRKYRHDLSAKRAYHRLQNTRRSKIVSSGKTSVSWKSQHSTITKSERATTRTVRFPNSYITVYCRHQPS